MFLHLIRTMSRSGFKFGSVSKQPFSNGQLSSWDDTSRTTLNLVVASEHYMVRHIVSYSICADVILSRIFCYVLLLNSSAPNLLNNFCSPGMAKDTCGVSTAFITIFCLGCQIFCSKTFTVIHFDLVGTKEPIMCIHSEFVFCLFHFPSMLVICHSCSFGCATT